MGSISIMLTVDFPILVAYGVYYDMSGIANRSVYYAVLSSKILVV